MCTRSGITVTWLLASLLRGFRYQSLGFRYFGDVASGITVMWLPVSTCQRIHSHSAKSNATVVGNKCVLNKSISSHDVQDEDKYHKNISPPPLKMKSKTYNSREYCTSFAAKTFSDSYLQSLLLSGVSCWAESVVERSQLLSGCFLIVLRWCLDSLTTNSCQAIYITIATAVHNRQQITLHMTQRRTHP